MKETFKLWFEIGFFLLISVPIACLLYLTAHVYFELKRIYNGIRFRTKRI
jgi:hypothetical protein